MMRYKNIYARAIDKWGVEAQCDQAVEECAELIATLKHFRRDRACKERSWEFVEKIEGGTAGSRADLGTQPVVA